jgi:hypothetical protein
LKTSWQKHFLASSGYRELGMLDDAANALEEIEPEDKTRNEESISNRGLIRTSCPDQVWGVNLRPLFSVISISDREPISR